MHSVWKQWNACVLMHFTWVTIFVHFYTTIILQNPDLSVMSNGFEPHNQQKPTPEKNSVRRRAGVGILTNPRLSTAVSEFTPVNERVASLRLRVVWGKTLRALSCTQSNWLSTLTHVSLLVCTQCKADFPRSKQAPLPLCLERSVGKKQRRVPAKWYLVLF